MFAYYHLLVLESFTKINVMTLVLLGLFKIQVKHAKFATLRVHNIFNLLAALPPNGFIMEEPYNFP